MLNDSIARGRRQGCGSTAPSGRRSSPRLSRTGAQRDTRGDLRRGRILEGFREATGPESGAFSQLTRRSRPDHPGTLALGPRGLTSLRLPARSLAFAGPAGDRPATRRDSTARPRRSPRSLTVPPRSPQKGRHRESPAAAFVSCQAGCVCRQLGRSGRATRLGTVSWGSGRQTSDGHERASSNIAINQDMRPDRELMSLPSSLVGQDRE